MEFDISRFRETFFQEADEHLAAMESGLLQLEQSSDPELLNAVFRGAHSIKGASGTFGFEDVARFTHAMEGLLDRMRAGAVEPSAARIGLLLESLDILRRLLEAARSGAALQQQEEETLFICPQGFELVLKLLDFLFLVFVGRVLQDRQRSFQGLIAFVAQQS